MTIRWGIIGCGDVARRRVAGAINEHAGSELIAACRRDSAALRSFCDDFGVQEAYQDYRDLLSNEAIDAVYIATPVVGHREQAVAAARSGKHVLVEKPMAMTTAECDEMINACHDAGRLLGLAYYRRFYPVVARMKELIAAGEIGTPRSVTAVTCNPFRLQPSDEGYWRVLPEDGGGGALMDIGSHRLDLFEEVFGEITEACGYCDNIGADYDADNTTTVIVRFANGCQGVVQCYFGVSVDPDQFTVLGSEGRLCATPLNAGSLQIETPQGSRQEAHPPAENFNLPLIADFVQAIESGTRSRVDGESGRRTNDVMRRAYECSRS